MDDGITVNGLSSTVCFAGVVARVESTWQVDGLFDPLLSESFGGKE
jgi:hypothetical protein